MRANLGLAYTSAMNVHALPIRTARVIIRRPTAADIPAILAYHDRNRAHLEPWEPTRPARFHEAEYWAERIGTLDAEFESRRAVRMILLPHDDETRVIGMVGVSMIQGAPLHGANLGYALDAAAQGRGLMHETLRAVVDLAFGPLALHRLFAAYIPGNERSGRVLRRLGFEVIGYCRDYLEIAGRWQDHILTSLLNPAWQSPPA